MGRRSRFLPADVAEGLQRQETLQRGLSAFVFGPLVRIAFPAAGAVRQVAHGLGVVPDGFLPAKRTGAVYEVSWDDWTADLALLQAPVAHTLAVGRFFVWAVAEEETPV